MLRRLLPPLVALGSAVATATPALAATDPLRPQQWGLEMIGAPEAWAAGRGAGTTIAVVDSGADLRHEDLVSNLLPGRSYVGSSPQDDDGHGTHVSGIAAGSADNGRGIAGVAPDAKIVPIKALGPNGGRSSDVAAGIRFAADTAATVINLSLGPDVPLVFGALDTSLVDAIEYAWSKGAICILAAGNNALPVSDYGDLDAIVVTAVDRRDRKPTYATSVGEARWGLAAPGGAGPEGALPEDDVVSTYWVRDKANQYDYLAGTSMAAPYVAGAAAILRGLGLSAQQTVDRLLATARDLGARGRDGTYGSGRLDLARAVQGLPNNTIAPPTSPPLTSAPATSAPATSAPATSAPPTSAERNAAPASTAPTPRPPGNLPPPGEAPNADDGPTPDPPDNDTVTTAGRSNDAGSEERHEDRGEAVGAKPGKGTPSDSGAKPIVPAVVAAGLVVAGAIALAVRRRHRSDNP